MIDRKLRMLKSQKAIFQRKLRYEKHQLPATLRVIVEEK